MNAGRYQPVVRPFEAIELSSGKWACVAPIGEVAFLNDREMASLKCDPSSLSPETVRNLKARHILVSREACAGLDRLYASRLAEKQATRSGDVALHIIVPTLQCAHSCRYCQVSRALDDDGFSLSQHQLLAACETIMESSAEVLTVEFQGGDPLNRFDLVELAMEVLAHHPRRGGRQIRFVIASTLHQLTPAMCRYFLQYDVKLSTSLDGPEWIHNRNRPTPSRDAHQRTVAAMRIAREILGEDAVSALMTATRLSLEHPEEIVDEYVRLGMREIFLRPLSPYGFARRNAAQLAYSTDRFMAFYDRALDRVLWWNERGVPIREVYASLILNKLISSFDAGYVDLQSPNASGQAVLVYNYDGWVYPSDEARMLAESGDLSFRMGAIGSPLQTLLAGEVVARIRAEGDPTTDPDCLSCAFKTYCAPSPVDAASAFGPQSHTAAAKTRETEHCRRQTAMFGLVLERLEAASDGRGDVMQLYEQWARPIAATEIA